MIMLGRDRARVGGRDEGEVNMHSLGKEMMKCVLNLCPICP